MSNEKEKTPYERGSLETLKEEHNNNKGLGAQHNNAEKQKSKKGIRDSSKIVQHPSQHSDNTNDPSLPVGIVLRAFTKERKRLTTVKKEQTKNSNYFKDPFFFYLCYRMLYLKDLRQQCKRYMTLASSQSRNVSPEESKKFSSMVSAILNNQTSREQQLSAINAWHAVVDKNYISRNPREVFLISTLLGALIGFVCGFMLGLGVGALAGIVGSAVGFGALSKCALSFFRTDKVKQAHHVVLSAHTLINYPLNYPPEMLKSQSVAVKKTQLSGIPEGDTDEGELSRPDPLGTCTK